MINAYLRKLLYPRSKPIKLMLEINAVGVACWNFWRIKGWSFYQNLPVEGCLHLGPLVSACSQFMPSSSTISTFKQRYFEAFHAVHSCSQSLLQPFTDETYLFYIRNQLVPRSKHSPLRL